MVQVIDPPSVPRILDYDRVFSGKSWTGRVLVARHLVDHQHGDPYSDRGRFRPPWNLAPSSCVVLKTEWRHLGSPVVAPGNCVPAADCRFAHVVMPGRDAPHRQRPQEDRDEPVSGKIAAGLGGRTRDDRVGRGRIRRSESRRSAALPAQTQIRRCPINISHSISA